MNHPNTSKSQQKRKFLLVLPLLTLPFLTLTFWALGGGKQSDEFQIETKKEGFNLELPGLIENQEKALDKLGHYQRSSEDSSRFRQEVKNDPYYRMVYQEEQKGIITSTNAVPSGNNHSTPLYQNLQEAQILQRLEALNKTLNETPQSPSLQERTDELPSHSIPDSVPNSLSSDLDRLDQMMMRMQNSNSAPDPEMKQMAELLDRILDIQHPERVQQRMLAIKEHSQSAGLAPIPNEEFTVLESITPNSNPIPTNGFYGLESDSFDSHSSTSIRAVIQEDQTLVSGSTVKLRITEEISLNGKVVPKDQLVYGHASLNGERLKISIQKIRIADQILTVNLKIHDADGLEGIRIPGSIAKDVSSQSGSQAIQGMSFNSFDYGLEAQAASAGIETAKSFLGKKIKQVKVNLKAGYQVWIINNN